jgi:type III pantothenate kinase
MSERRLLIDQGNSRVKWLWAEGHVLDEASAGRGDSEAFTAACEAGERPAEVLLSSVAGPAAVQPIFDLCRRLWAVEPRRLVARAEQGGVRSAYSKPSTLGVDRWLAIIGAVARHGKPVVVWDLGTASTVDAVDDDGQHLGGMIYPGPATMLRALDRDTELPVPADLSLAGIQDGPAAGTDTAACIAQGILAAQLGALNQFMKWSAARMVAEPRLVVAGGAVTDLLPLLDFDYTHDPWLVFAGMLVD